MTRLLDRAKKDAHVREQERREEAREERKKFAAEIAAIQERAVEFVNKKLGIELAPSALTPQEHATPVDEEMGWDFQVETHAFEVVRKRESGVFSLYFVPNPEDPDGDRHYVRRLADIADALEAARDAG